MDLQDLPHEVEERAKEIKQDNPDMDKSTAIAIARDQLNMSAGEVMELDGPCESGYVMIGTKTQDGQEVPNCVPKEETGELEPPSLNNSIPRIMQGATRLDLQPIEREELEGGKVAYRNIKLIDEGVWTDENSRTPTLYDTETFENTEPKAQGYDGPPVNIHHDLNAQGEPNEASVGGHIDPNSLSTDGDALFGDLILDTDEAAGDFADENLQSSLESNGEVGFSPSVELTPTAMGEADHPQAEEHVKAAELTGLGLVRDPASKSVDFAHETRKREVAMSANSQNVKVLSKVTDNMVEIADLREQYNLSEDIDESTVKELHEAGALTLEDDEEEEEPEMAEGEDEEEEPEEEDEPKMEEGAIDSLEEQIDDLWGKIEEMEEAMMGEEMQSALSEATEELEDTKQELSALKEDKKELQETVEEQDKRLSKVEEEPEDPKTLSDNGGDNDSWDPVYDKTPSETSGW